jgi:D-tyrosyl-tRNA(Tyr) deacylase
MRAVVQRVSNALVRVGGETVGRVAHGLCAFVGVGRDDTDDDAQLLADKILNLRIFEDDAGRMNQSVLDVGGALLAVSQFTLYGDARKGRRPSFTLAMEPVRANELFEAFCGNCRERGITVETGRFRATMQVELSNEGPVTILLDTKRAF